MEADGNGNSGRLARFERRIRAERGGSKVSKLQVEISTGLRPKVHRPCGAKTHTHTNTFLTAPSALVFTVQLSMKRVSSRVEKKKKSVQMHHHGGHYTQKRV